ncbi:RluA family pseudouridine synthase [Vandammella animalimorsus]|nr:RluA family pseudouridine synthase [Vandammella animalimorsus]
MSDLEYLESLQGAAQPEFDLSGELREQPVAAALHGARLDKALLELAPEFSRSHLQQLIRSGQVWLDGATALKPAQKVAVGQCLRVALQPTEQSQAFVPEPMALDIVYEDQALLVINKPAGLVVHPAAGHWRGTLLNGLLAHAPVFATLPRAGIVHRLDKDTSGLMVVAKSLPAATALVAQIAQRAVARRYLAVAHAGPGARAWPEAGQALRVDAPIGRDPQQRLRMAVVDLQRHPGKPAQTDMRLLARQGGFALLHCALHTGRTHQIRVHAKHLGWPLVGDATYGGQPHPAIARQALHAWQLALAHPLHGQPLRFCAAPPQDMQQLLQALQLPWPETAEAELPGAGQFADNR